MSVLFADIWGFTQFSADLPGPEVMAILREYLGLAEAAVFENHGTLDKFLGDGLMATERNGSIPIDNDVHEFTAWQGLIRVWPLRLVA